MTGNVVASLIISAAEDATCRAADLARQRRDEGAARHHSEVAAALRLARRTVLATPSPFGMQDEAREILVVLERWFEAAIADGWTFRARVDAGELLESIREWLAKDGGTQISGGSRVVDTTEDDGTAVVDRADCLPRGMSGSDE